MPVRVLAAVAVAIVWVSLCVWYSAFSIEGEEHAYEKAERIKAETLANVMTDTLRNRLAGLRTTAFILAGRVQVSDALPFVEYVVNDNQGGAAYADRLSDLQANLELRKISENFHAIAGRLRLKSIKLLHLSGEVVASSAGHDKKGGLAENLRGYTFFKDLRKINRLQDIIVSEEGELVFQFASPVRIKDQVMGAILVEQSARTLSDLISGQDGLSIVTDAMGTIVLSENPAYLGKTTPKAFSNTLSDDQRKERYRTAKLNPIDINLDGKPDIGSWVHVPGDDRIFTHLFSRVHPDTLKLHVLAPLDELEDIRERIVEGAILAGVIGLMIILGLERSLAFGQTLQRRNAALAEANETVTRAMEERSQFFARMSHEIRTPMTGVLGMLEQVELTALDQDQSQMVDAVRKSAESLLVIINDILDMSKIEAGKLAIEALDVDIADIIEQVALSMAPLCQEKGIFVSCYVDPAIKTSYATDPVRLKQIIYNFATNSVKFTEQGGVQLRVDLLQEGSSHDEIVFSVADSGIGMDGETLSRLFRPFEQAEKSTARRFGGTGLGLSICQSLADMMGGTLSVNSTPGVGSSFKATFQLEKRNDAPLERPPSDFLEGRAFALQIVNDVVSDNVARYLAAASGTISPHGSEVDLTLFDTADPDVEHFGKTLQLSALPTVAAEGQAAAGHLQRNALIAKIGRELGLDPSAFEIKHGELTAAVHRTPSRDEALANQALILFADDHPVNRQVISRHLNSLGYAVDTFEDGRQAIDGYNRGGYALVLTDINMPYLSGVDLSKAIREDEEKHGGQKRIPILAITASIVPEEAEACIQAGVDEVLLKPIIREKLGQAIDKWMPGKATEIVSAETEQAPAPAPAPQNNPDADEHIFIDVASMVEMLGDDPAFLKDILADFVASTRPDFENLKQALSDADASAVYQASHRITGACNMIGALGVGAMSLQVEMLAKEGNVSPDHQAIKNLIAETKKLFLYLETVDLAALLANERG